MRNNNKRPKGIQMIKMWKRMRWSLCRTDASAKEQPGRKNIYQRISGEDWLKPETSNARNSEYV